MAKDFKAVNLLRIPITAILDTIAQKIADIYIWILAIFA